MRLFVGLDIDPTIRAAIAQFADGMRGFAPDVRWIKPESLHITLKFIGEWQRLDELKHALAAVRGDPVQISFGAIGFFPTAKSARVFWIGIDAQPQLATLANSIVAATSKLGIESEKRAFTPHLTLARSGSGRPQRTSGDRNNSLFQHLQTRLAAMPSPTFGKMTAREFFLFESKLSSKGAQYTKLERFPLE